MSKKLKLSKAELGNQMQAFIEHGPGTDSGLVNKTINKNINTYLNKELGVKRLVVDIPADLHRDIKLFCVGQGCKMNEFIRDAAHQWLKEKKDHCS